MQSRVIDIVEVIAHILVALVAFATGLASASTNGRSQLGKRGLLARSLVAIGVVVPLLAVLVVKMVAPSDQVSAGLLVTAIAIGPVAALKTSSKLGGERVYALRLNVVLSAASIVFVPAAVVVLGAVFRREVAFSAAEVAAIVLPLQLLPLSAGIVMRRLAPGVSARVQKPLSLGTNVAVGLLAVPVLIVMFKPMLALGGAGLLAIATLAVGAVLIGHLLGGPERDTRHVLATFSALRFPVLALALAEHTRQGRAVVPVVLAYLFISLITLALYFAAAALRSPGGDVGRGATLASGR